MNQTIQTPETTQIKRNMRRLIYTANSSLIVLIVIAALVIINLLAVRLNLRMDVTKNKFYSLSEQSIQAAKELDKQKVDLQIFGFYRDGDQNRDMVEDLLKEYKKRCDRINYKFIDPMKDQALTKQYQIQELGTLVFAMAGKEMKVLSRDMFQQTYEGPGPFTGEQAITRTIYKMLNAETNSIYLLQGHGEKEYTRAKEYITGEGYEVKTLSLMKEGKIPDDCSQLVIAGPQLDILGPEMKLIEDYLSQGGRVMLFLDFPPAKSALTNVTRFLNSWGIDFEDAIVIETERRTMFDYTTVIPNYQYHEVTAKLQEARIDVLLPANRPLAKLQDYQGQASASVILESSANSWGERNPRGQVKKDANETTGPVPLAIVATQTGSDGEGRLIVLGTSSFLDDQIVDQGGNLNLFYNMTSWLLGQEERISITPKQMEYARVNLNPMQALIIRSFVLFILPVALLVLGGWIWFRRRAQ